MFRVNKKDQNDVNDPAPFWANLYLSKHGYGFMSKLTKKDIA